MESDSDEENCNIKTVSPLYIRCLAYLRQFRLCRCAFLRL